MYWFECPYIIVELVPCTYIVELVSIVGHVHNLNLICFKKCTCFVCILLSKVVQVGAIKITSYIYFMVNIFYNYSKLVALIFIPNRTVYGMNYDTIDIVISINLSFINYWYLCFSYFHFFRKCKKNIKLKPCLSGFMGPEPVFDWHTTR